MITRLTTKGTLAAIAVLVASFMNAVPAESVPAIKFDQAPTINAGGIIYWTGDAADPLVGLRIGFQTIKGEGTPLNDSVPGPTPADLFCTGCLLNFETGAHISGATPGIVNFGAGGFFTLDVGTTLGDGIAAGPAPGQAPAFGGIGVGENILLGSFRANPAKPISIGVGPGIFTGFGIDVKHDAINTYFGTGPDYKFTNTNIYGSLGTQAVGMHDLFDFDSNVFSDNEVFVTLQAGGFIIKVDNGDITNNPVPEPGSTTLLLLGLGGLAAFRRRRN